MLKKLSFVLLLAVLLVSLPTTAFAAGTVKVSLNAQTVRLESVTDGEVTVTVSISGASGLAGGCLAVGYDPTVFLFEGKNAVDPDCDAAMFIRRGRAADGYPVLLQFTDALPKSGIVASFTLKLLPTAAPGSYDLKIREVSPLVSAEGEALPTAFENGAVSLTAYEPCESLTLQALCETPSIRPGESFTVIYRVAGIPETGLSDFDFFITYDADLVTLQSLSLPDSVSGFSLLGFADAETGHLCGTVGNKVFTGDSLVGYAVFTAGKICETDAVISIYPGGEADDPRTAKTAFSAAVDGDILRYEMPALQPCTVRISVPCDLNGDGVESILDVTALLRYLSTHDPQFAIVEKVDVNGDDTDSILDVTALLKALSKQ